MRLLNLVNITRASTSSDSIIVVEVQSTRLESFDFIAGPCNKHKIVIQQYSDRYAPSISPTGVYSKLLELGVGPECARSVLPAASTLSTLCFGATVATWASVLAEYPTFFNDEFCERMAEFADKIKMLKPAETPYFFINGMEKPGDAISYCARLSSPQNQAQFDSAERLLGYCIKHGHWSVFTTEYVVVSVRAPMYVHHQLIRHQSMNIVSKICHHGEAYSQEWRAPGKTSRQSTVASVSIDSELETEVGLMYEDNLLCGTEYTVEYCLNVRSLYHLLTVRMDWHAQRECIIAVLKYFAPFVKNHYQFLIPYVETIYGNLVADAESAGCAVFSDKSAWSWS
jgi:thymidylate synthase ThyX